MSTSGKKWVTGLPSTAQQPVLAAGDLDRERRRILLRLAVAQARLEPVSGTTRYAVRTTRTKSGVPRIRMDAAYVSAFVREGLLQPDSNQTYVLSDLGRQWVARATAAQDPFRSQHQLEGTRLIDGRGTGTKTALTPMRVNLSETPLGWLRRRKGAKGQALITLAQFEAGERLRADFTSAQMTPRTTADWSMAPDAAHTKTGDRMTMSDRALAARQRFYKAVDAVGPGLAEPLVDVCCYLNGLEDAERRMGWPQRAGKIVLAIALDRLADHYGFNGNTKRSGKIGLWRADGR